jgi:branched-chain amino acid transport system ATP-binding protein
MLRLEGIRAGYRKTQILHGVDLVVPEGSAVGLLGPNGAGKTTLLRIAAGLMAPTTGSIMLDGERVEHCRAHERARRGLCLIPEGRAIFRQLTVRENIAMQVGGRGVNDAIDRAATAFPILRDRLNQQAGTMSGGQQQMLAVARALVTNARIVLADELSMGLAPVIIDEIFEAVQVLREAGVSLLIVEQYVDRVLAVADYVYLLHKGQVVFIGEPAQCQAEDIFHRYLGAAVA